jgi:DNA-binding transcriptional regulator/RsmH inhibitor MraZ
MFQGAAALSLDAKGRLAIPARHREALASAASGRLVLTAHPHRCLLLYPGTSLGTDSRQGAGGIEFQSAGCSHQASAGR